MPKEPKKISPNSPDPKLRKVEHSRSQATMGKKPPGLQLCQKCQAVYYKKRWQWDYPLYEKYSHNKDLLTTCPACSVTRPTEAEGILELSGFVSADQKKEILNLIKNAGRRATERDPLDKIFKITTSGKSVVVYTTENQLAMGLGRQVRQAFGGDINIATASEEDIVRVRWAGDKPED